MGGSGSRLSKELLAEYQVRGTLGPGEPARWPALGSGVPEQAAGRARPPDGPLTPLSFCLPGLDVPDQAGDSSVSAVSNSASGILWRQLRGLCLTDGQTEAPRGRDLPEVGS